MKFKFNELSNKDQEFLDRIYSDGLEKYEKRIQQYGLVGKKNVLDAGSGFAQWSIALSKHNDKVTSIEFNKQRVEVSKQIAKELNIKNIEFLQGSIGNLPFQNDTFDGVFCYGVIFLTDWKKSLKELSRVLKKDGVVYLNANGIGWYYNLIINEHNKTSDYNPREYAIDSIINTERYHNNPNLYKSGLDVIIDQNELLQELTVLGFKNIIFDGEGKINAINPKPFFKEEYFNELGCYELMAIKGNECLM